MKTTYWTAALVVLCAGPASAQVSEAAGLRANVPFAMGPVDLNLGGTLHRVSTSAGLRTPFNYEATIRIPGASSGVWFGSRVEGASEVDSAPNRPLVLGGLWKTLGRLTLSISGATHSARIGGRAAKPDSLATIYNAWIDTAPPRFVQIGDTVATFRQGKYVRRDTLLKWVVAGEGSRVALWSDFEGRAGWTLGRASMEAVLGARPAIGPYSAAKWARVGASYPFSDRLSLAAFAGTDPGHVGFRIPSSMFASVALRARPWRRTAGKGTDLAPLVAFNAEREFGSRYRITYLVPRAKTVEVSGDFDRWRPVAMKQTRDGVWEVSLPLTPGTYRVNVRIDGGRWLPPAGLPQAEDEFNGAVGVLVVR